MTTLALAQQIGHRAHRLHARIAVLVARPWFWLAAIALFFALPILRTAPLPAPPPLPVLTAVPAFQLTDEHGESFGSAQLQGKVWIANFIFTSCAQTCPRFTAKMAKIQHRIRHIATAAHLVSITVDPEHDTPEVLAAYAKAHRASPRMWSFLSGDAAAIKATVTEGLKTAYGPEKLPGDGEFQTIFHGTSFVLVDQHSRIRGFYDSNDDARIDDLVRDAGLLANYGG